MATDYPQNQLTLNSNANVLKEPLSVQRFLVILLFTWIATAVLKLTGSSLLIRIAVLSLFLALSLKLVHVKTLIKPAHSKTGVTSVFLYVLITGAAFIGTGGTLYSLQNEILPQFLRQDLFWNGIAAPCYEEVFFRGFVCYFLWNQLAQAKNRTFWAVYISSLIFWIFHAPAEPAVWVEAISKGGIPLGPGPFLLGLVCGFVFLRDGSVRWAVALHAIANLAGPFWFVIIRNKHVLQLFYSF